MNQVRIRNLFVIEYEGEQVRLRYHDLFRDFLQDTLRNQNEARFRELTLRAAEAYAARGEWERAVSRYLTLGHFEPVVEIIDRLAVQLFDAGRWDTLAGWIDALPEESLVANPDFPHPTGQDPHGAGRACRGPGPVRAGRRDIRRHRQRAGSRLGIGHERLHTALSGTLRRGAGPDARRHCSWSAGPANEERAAMAMAHKNAGLCHFRQGHLDRGRAALAESARLYEALADSHGEGMVYHDLGLAHELMGDLSGAEKHYQAALQRWEQLGSPGPWANTLNGLGVVYYLQGKYDQAAQTLEEALAKSRRSGDLRVEAFVWASLGDLHRDQGAYERAQQAYAQALEIANRSRIGFIQTYATSGMGNISRLQGDTVRAASQLDRALAPGRPARLGLRSQPVPHLAGRPRRRTGDLDTARRHLDLAIERFPPAASGATWLRPACSAPGSPSRPGTACRPCPTWSRPWNWPSNWALTSSSSSKASGSPSCWGTLESKGLGDSIPPGLMERLETHQRRGGLATGAMPSRSNRGRPSGSMPSGSPALYWMARTSSGPYSRAGTCSSACSSTRRASARRRSARCFGRNILRTSWMESFAPPSIVCAAPSFATASYSPTDSTALIGTVISGSTSEPSRHCWTKAEEEND